MSDSIAGQTASLGEVASEPVEQSGPAHEFIYVDISSIDRESKRIEGTKTLSVDMAPSRARQVLRAGDVLVSMTRPNLNAVALVPSQLDGAIGSTGFHVLRSKWIKPEFLFGLVQTDGFVKEMCGVVQGALYPAVRPKDIASFRFVLRSPLQQTRIVEKLQELLSNLDAGVAELKAAQKRLAQYRQSLLKAAVEGALTAEWRKHNTAAETGAQLLERILKERRARWEAKQLAKFAEQGKVPPKNWRERYQEPVRPDMSDMPDLPQGWVWASLDQLLCQLRSGTAETSGREVTKFPVLKSSAVRQGNIDFMAINYLKADQSFSENYLESGDLLITRLSGSVEYVGCCAIAYDIPDGGMQYPDRIFCGKLATKLSGLGEFLVCCFRNPRARVRIEAAAKSTAGHKRISISDLHPFPIPLPPHGEIIEMCRLLGEALKQTQGADAGAQHSLKQAAAQRKNILKAAFFGELVPQDLNDEPASALLERIRSEREQKSHAKARKR